MERSRRRIRDLVALAAFQGPSRNEIGCARMSIMARSKKVPCKGRIQKRKTNHLQIITFGLQRTAGPYRSANRVRSLAAGFNGCIWRKADIAIFHIPAGLNGLSGAALRW